MWAMCIQIGDQVEIDHAGSLSSLIASVKIFSSEQ